MLSKQATHALKALLRLSAEPLNWQSTHQLAAAQQLPEAMLEQVLLRLRRSGVLVARRGRLGGYRLARAPREIALAEVLAALAEPASERPNPKRAGLEDTVSAPSAAEQVTAALQRRLERARLKALAELSLEDLLFDLRSAEASTDAETGLLLG